MATSVPEIKTKVKRLEALISTSLNISADEEKEWVSLVHGLADSFLAAAPEGETGLLEKMLDTFILFFETQNAQLHQLFSKMKKAAESLGYKAKGSAREQFEFFTEVGRQLEELATATHTGKSR